VGEGKSNNRPLRGATKGNKMKVINAAKGPNVKNYFYDAERDVFDT